MHWNELEYANDLSFAKECIEQFRINFIISEYPYDNYLDEIVYFLSSTRPNTGIHEKILSSISDLKPNTIYRLTDTFSRLFYVFLLPGTKEQTIVFIGPYIQQAVSNDLLCQTLEKLHIHPSFLSEFESYFSNITLLNDDIAILAILHTLGTRMWGNDTNFQIMDSIHFIELFSENLDYTGMEPTEPVIHIKMLEQRYMLEQELMNAVSHGQSHQAELVFSRFTSSQRMEVRTPNLTRNTQNYLIVLNTLLRKAAQSGYVHPIHIDKLSSQFAKKIERLDYNVDIVQFGKEMVRKYCLLVRNYSLSEYSEIIRSALTLITSDLTADLSLNSIASTLNINASYLSTLFKKELGMTLTEYVTKRRIEHAVFLLNSTSMQIAAVARECGLPDVQYFSKLFKKQINISPSEYRKMITD